MGGIGNDIIALKIINPNRTNTPRFYNKILAVTEVQLYRDRLADIPFHYFVWLAWSVKESAYKCLQRFHTDLVFSPTKIVITDIKPPVALAHLRSAIVEDTGFNDMECFVIEAGFEKQKFYFRSTIYGDDLIHTIASLHSDFSNINWGLKQIEHADPETQSLKVREFLLYRLKREYPESDPIISKDRAGIPFTDIGDNVLPISLSHHANWVGYAF